MADDPVFESVDDLRKAAAESLGFGKAAQAGSPDMMGELAKMEMSAKAAPVDPASLGSIAFDASPAGADDLSAATDKLSDIFKTMR